MKTQRQRQQPRQKLKLMKLPQPTQKKKADVAKQMADIKQAKADADVAHKEALKAKADQKAADAAAAAANAASLAADKAAADAKADADATAANSAASASNKKAKDDSVAAAAAAAAAADAKAAALAAREAANAAEAKEKADNTAAEKQAIADKKQQKDDEAADAKATKDAELAVARAEKKANKAHGRGDPHMMNINGDRFNIVKEGNAPLIKIPAESAALLNVAGYVQRAHERKCMKQIFFTQVNVSGSWLEKSVSVKVGSQTDPEKALDVTVDGQQVWSAATEGKAVLFSHEKGKFSITKMKNQETPGVKIHLAEDPNVLIEVQRPMYRANSRAHLNLNLAGLESLANFWSVVGILGNDDHSLWTTDSTECKSLKNFARVAMDAKELDDEWSFASASLSL